MSSPSSRPKPLSTKVNTLWNMAGCIFYLGCQWLTTIIVVLFSKGFDNSGLLAFAMATGNMFASISLYKIRTFQVSDLKGEYSNPDYIGFRLLTITISMLFSIAYLAFITDDMTLFATTILYLIFKADETFADVLYGIDQRNGRMDYIGKSQLLRGAATLLGFTAPILATGNLLYAIAGMLMACASVTLLYDFRNAGKFGPCLPSFKFSKFSGLFKACLLPTIANFFATSIVSIARQRYGILAGETSLGLYASIATPAVLIQAGAAYLYSPLIGSLAKTLHERGIYSFKSSALKILLLIIIGAGLPSAVLTIVAPTVLVTLFGNDLLPHIWVFPYSLIATISIAALLYINDILLILRDGKTQIAINALALALTAFLTEGLIGKYGMNGINVTIITSATIASFVGLLRIGTADKSNPSKETTTQVDQS
ncbi:lipopolysaccharide biosynthesis protein [Collinsella intestinalis]|uniref:lipopolysaccharide biosynthesis protein n=1 Tax=Collinsella intestinalis TaxID=147207 RepID=UPI00241C486A|nr:hypothetical protein [Collinsella intestinalis]